MTGTDNGKRYDCPQLIRDDMSKTGHFQGLNKRKKCDLWEVDGGQ